MRVRFLITAVTASMLLAAPAASAQSTPRGELVVSLQGTTGPRVRRLAAVQPLGRLRLPPQHLARRSRPRPRRSAAGRVAQSWTYQPGGFAGVRQNEIRMTNVARTETYEVAAMGTGIGGQTYLGPSIAEGRVAFFRACLADPGGCSSNDSGAIRYRISNGSYEIAGADEAWSSSASSGSATYDVPSAYACTGGGPGAAMVPCGIIRARDLPWRPLDAERAR
jgi:hypothetical protein